MAVQICSIDDAKNAGGSPSVKRIYWAPMANGDTGIPIPFPDWADRTIQCWTLAIDTGASSVIGVGGSVSIEGSNDYQPFAMDTSDPANAGTWTVLTDQNGVAMTYTAVALKQMTEAPLFVRPHVTAGDGTTLCNVVLVMRRIQPQLRGA
jgi:hypothetical protein